MVAPFPELRRREHVLRHSGLNCFGPGRVPLGDWTTMTKKVTMTMTMARMTMMAFGNVGSDHESDDE